MSSRPNNDDDDDLLLGLGDVPGPDAEPTAAERAHAKAFADIVDKALVDHTPPAMSTEDRALLDVANVIRAASGHATLADERRGSIVEAALASAIRAKQASIAPPVASAPPADNVPITAGRRRLIPWMVASASSLAAAAAIVLLVTRAPRVVEIHAKPTTPVAWTSRPADALIGPIQREHAGDALSRIDTIFADRMDGFRERTLGGKP